MAGIVPRGASAGRLLERQLGWAANQRYLLQYRTSSPLVGLPDAERMRAALDAPTVDGMRRPREEAVRVVHPPLVVIAFERQDPLRPSGDACAGSLSPSNGYRLTNTRKWRRKPRIAA